MKFSFLMAVNKYNPYFKEAIESVCSQTDGNFEFYIIANNCDDALWEFIQSFSDPRIKAFRTGIGQLAYNLNFGLDLIKEGYALRMDSDDVSLPDRLKETRMALENLNYPDILAGDAIIINGENKEIGYAKVPNQQRNIEKALWRTNPFIHPACAIRVETIRALKGYSGGFVSEDYDLWLRASRVPSIVLNGVNKPMIKYRIHGEQARGNRLAYAEVAGYMLREFLIGSGLKYLFGAMLATIKNVVRGK